jgi:hypothetical protein
MTKSTMMLDQTEDVLLVLDVSDCALEMAAKTEFEGGAYTISFCTGLDSCPAVSPA